MQPDNHTLQKRDFRLADNGDLLAVGNWYEGKPLSTHFLNAYTLLIPDGEKFIIRTCSRYLEKVSPDLADELRRLFYQEGSHSREHGRVLKAMDSQGTGLPAFRRLIGWFSYHVLEPLTPLKWRLSTAAAIEHHNAVIASHFLGDAQLSAVKNVGMRRLFLWHFSEEIEHKETVFKLLQSTSRSVVLRAVGLFFSTGTFLLYLAIGTLLSGLRAGAIFSSGFWGEFIRCLRPNGLVGVVFRESLRYLKPSFRPSYADSKLLLEESLAELERIDASTGGVEPRPIPEKFRWKMERTMGRYLELQSRNPFFFQPIDHYDGVWIHADGARKLNFCTYSYLGLLHEPRVRDAAKDATERFGTGTHGVRLLGGNLRIHEELESCIAAFFRRQAAITFSSGFMTNKSVMGTLVGKGDYVLSDEFNHASIVDGGRFSRAEIIRFCHNNMADLSEKLSLLPEDSRKLIVVDAVYSMDGDIAPLRELIRLRDAYPNTLLMVDEAHSLGVLGENGRGIEEHFDCVGSVDVLMGTLSKTIPCQGGFIAGSKELVTFLRYSARGFIFSAALSPAVSAAGLAAFKIIEKEGAARKEQLMRNVLYFINGLRDRGFNVGGSETAIVPVMLGSESLAFEIARECNVQGIYVMPVVYPAVPRGTERLRMNVTYLHRRQDLDFALQILQRARAMIDGKEKVAA